MEQTTVQRSERTVRIETIDGSVKGLLMASVLHRTLDHLNRLTEIFVTVHSPELDGTEWSFPDGPLSVNKGNILFLVELSEPDGGEADKFVDLTRAPVRFRVGGFDIEGFVHVPPTGDPLLRMNQHIHPFIAVTSASVVGPDTEFESPFIAVKTSHVLAAQPQPMDHEAPESSAESESSETDD